jgi:hypothetical protein
MMKLIIVSFFTLSSALAVTNWKEPVTYSATTTSGVALAANTQRNYLMMQNKGSSDVYIKGGSVHSGTEGITLSAGSSWEPEEAPVGSIYIKASTGTQSISIIEGNK